MAHTYQRHWASFCQQHELDTHLSTCPDPVAWFQVFATRVRDGRFSASGNPVRSGTVADALHFVAQTFTMLGLPDPRHTRGTGTLDPRLVRLLKGFTNADTAPVRVQPIPITILHVATSIATAANDPCSLAAADLMWLAFFFLLRPGEFCDAGPTSHPFCGHDVLLWYHDVPLDTLSATPAHLLQATFVSLTFRQQKNGTKNEKVGHGCTPSPLSCPVRSVVRRILHIRSNGGTLATPLCCYGPTLRPLKSSAISTLLHQASLASPTHASPAPFAAKALRATGATALLNQNIVGDKIKLLGRWKSDAMLRYLHLQAHHLMQDYSTLMLHGGDNHLLDA